jgi:hypothetical protein
MDILEIRGKERKERNDKYLGFSNLLPFTERLAGIFGRNEAETRPCLCAVT